MEVWIVSNRVMVVVLVFEEDAAKENKGDTQNVYHT